LRRGGRRRPGISHRGRGQSISCLRGRPTPRSTTKSNAWVELVRAVAPAAIAMTSQGSSSGRFTRAVQRGHLFTAEMPARELGHMSLSNALSLCILYGREQDPKFDRAAVRWVRRMQLEHSLRRQEADLLRAAMAALGTRLDAAALNALLETCRELRLVPPTLQG